MGINIDIEKCDGCGSCVSACPFDAIEIANDKAQVNDKCTLCGACQQACPLDAIEIEGAQQETSGADDSQGVWVFAEQRGGKVKGVAHELLSKGRELADDLGTELSAVVMGFNVRGVDELIHYGADRVYVFDYPTLEDCSDDLYAAYLAVLIREHRPQILLAGATSLGRSLLPKVAAMLETGLTADCTGLEIDKESGLLLQTRPTFGGNIMATITCQTKRPQMATVRPHVFGKRQPDLQRKGSIVPINPFIYQGEVDEEAAARARILEFIEDVSESVKIEDADVIVSGGRGLGKAENFGIIRELADALGAAVGSSRACVDEGWIPYPHQVGQTGKTVCPKVYIACGISGAVQHLAGMQTSDVIIAINEDPNAPIFQVANYGIVGDLFEIVPLLTQKLKERQG
jgi:electron transfer flavoprotein alpha subunit